MQAIGDVNTELARSVSRKLQSAGAWAPLLAPGSTSDALAALLRPTSGHAPPLVVSPGHRISLQTAATLTAAVCRHSVAEPIRQADLRSRKAVRLWLAGTELSTIRLREPGTKRKSGQASCLPIVNRMLKQAHSARSATSELWTSQEYRCDDEEQENKTAEDEGIGGWGYCHVFFSWLLKDTGMGCCFRRTEGRTEPQIPEEPVAPRLMNKAAAENAAGEEAEDVSSVASTLTPEATEGSTDLVDVKSPISGSAKARRTHPKKPRVELKWRPKVV